MGLYNFKERFTVRILDGSKTHTIRPERSRPDKPGDVLHLYTGLRHKGARLLMRVPCVRVEAITMEERKPGVFSVTIDGVSLDRSECEAFARRDGFNNFDDMMDFWKGRLPFRGQIVHWKGPR
jgi:hypothetical protein